MLTRRILQGLTVTLATAALSSCSTDITLPDSVDVQVMEIDASEAPKDAEVESYCVTLLLAPSDSGPAQWSGWVALASEVGTPKAMGPAARQGYEDVLESAGNRKLRDTEVEVRDALEAVALTAPGKALAKYNRTACKVLFAEAARAGEPVAAVFDGS